MVLKTGAAAAALALTAAGAGISPVTPFVIPSGRPGEAECRGIVKTLNDRGFDQFLVYPSTGLEFEYLGKEFFAMIGHFLDEAERRGMKVWLYDEFNWPSGTARGRIPAENENCLYRELVAFTNASGSLGWRTVVSHGVNVDNYCLDTNNLEPESADRFRQLTHREYGRRFRKYMGGVIRGIFTDEPGHCSSAWRLAMPKGAVLRVPCWSGMEDEYRAASGGRDFRGDFEKAFAAGSLDKTDALRLWTEIRSIRYRRTFFDPITLWCRDMGIDSCGHLVGEDWPAGCARVNGMPLHTLKGLSKPGVDLIRSNTDAGFEWITLAFAQAAAMSNGKPGVAELFALGPCDLTFTIMRKLYWICALHRIDTYFQSLYHHRAFRFNVKDSYAMFTSPTQPWFDEMPLLHETAKAAAKWAAKPFKCDIALVYPQRQLGSFGVLKRGANPPLAAFCRELSWNQFTYRLIEEDEKTDLPVVLDWEGEKVVERRRGFSFASPAVALKWLEAEFADRPRVKDSGGRTRGGFITRAYLDGSAAAVDAATGEVIISENGELTPRPAAPAGREIAAEWSFKLSSEVRRRVWFWTAKADAQRETDKWLRREEKKESKPRYDRDNIAKMTLTEPLEGIRFALRRYPAEAKFSVKLDGRELDFPKPCKSVAYAFDELYRETEPMSLGAGEHVLELSGGKDGKLFMPVMWMIGGFAEKDYGVITPQPGKVRAGSLADAGFGSFAGTATYCAEAEFAEGEKLVVDAGGAVVKVSFGGRSLGARGWAPYEWEIPADLKGRRRRLEISVVTSIRPIFGDPAAPDAKLDHALWVNPSLDARPKVGLLGACAAAAKKGKDEKR